jgi:lambda family phage portal protein
VPYELLTGDMSRVNDRTVRVLLHGFRRRIMAWQHQIVAFQLCRRVWSTWLDRVFLSGALPIPPAYLTDPEPWARAKWIPQGWPYLQPVQDVEAQRAAIRAGFSSRSTTVGEQGEDAESIDAEQAADNARADGLGLAYDSDGRKPITGSAAPLPADSTEREMPAGSFTEGN